MVLFCSNAQHRRRPPRKRKAEIAQATEKIGNMVAWRRCKQRQRAFRLVRRRFRSSCRHRVSRSLLVHRQNQSRKSPLLEHRSRAGHIQNPRVLTPFKVPPTRCQITSPLVTPVLPRTSPRCVARSIPRNRCGNSLRWPKFSARPARSRHGNPWVSASREAAFRVLHRNRGHPP